MEYTETLAPTLVEVDMICDHCNRLITIGEDYYYDDEREEVLCEDCANRVEGK